ncbi:cell wall-binding repeat-containing protein [Metabacillus idriensis]|uniref:cell wall-binding repeat-containing protein n=1 Tax=Metabacillus idriensis TaxID=324768 RepID=UPI0028130085|nr:cell wall-binding repeat-containing protein [Metabacillus idriensis]MDR0138819.1 cell wall-binding repeat-containing protein [Metabacillus idriensis]
MCKLSFITSGSNFPDSLSASAVAARQGSPILLVKKTDVPASVRNYVNGFTKSYVIGGTGAIASGTASQLPYAERIAGANRYDSSAKVATKFASFSASRALLVC